jgi:hypothetical protein
VHTNLQFGGGSDISSMHPVVLVIVLAAAVAVAFLPRKHVLAVILPLTLLTPYGEQVLVGGAHLYVFRILVFAGFVRMISATFSSQSPLFRARLGPVDRAFFLWALFRGVALLLLYRAGGAIVADVAFCLDTYGGYLLFRYLIQDKGDIFRATKILVFISAILALCMSFEYATRTNVFSYISMTPIVPWLREGKVRAQGTFSNSITAGSFGAILLPLYFWLWKSRLAKSWGIVGIIGATTIVLTSMASTAVMAYLGGVLALCLWPIRSRMRAVRWGIVLLVVGLALVMKAPVWFIIARVDIIGSSHGWDRAYLIDQTVRHFSDWWLIGTRSSASWGNDTWDACNQFVAEAVTGGLGGLIAFLIILSRAFSLLGKRRKQTEGSRDVSWFYWCLGAALFANVMAFNGVDYFDLIQVVWLMFLVMVSVATGVAITKGLPKQTHAGAATYLVASDIPEPACAPRSMGA